MVKKIGRPRKQVDKQTIFKLAKLHCSNKDIAEFTGVSVDTITRNFADILEKGRQVGKVNLRRAQFKTAYKGNPTLLVWLGKQVLGQKDNVEVSHKGLIEEELDFIDMPKDTKPDRFSKYFN